MGCQRSGMCCTLFFLPISPEELKLKGEEYKKHPYEINGIPARVDEMARMLEDRHVGKLKTGTGHLYGPCKNLFHTTDGNGKTIAGCMIHDNKPYTCVEYPNYFKEQNPTKIIPLNPSDYKGCGYNINSEHGKTLDEQLVGLEEQG